MSEYTEDCEDLLDGEDEEELLNRSKKPAEDDFALLDLEEDEEKKNQRDLDLELVTDIDLENIDLNIDNEMDGTSDGEQEKEKEKSNERDRRETQTVGTLLENPPGLDLFKSINEKLGFHYFNSDDLSLELDFLYSRRGKLKGHGYSDKEIDEMLSHRLTFIRHLMPEGQSVLLNDKADFRAICDFLFFSISVCTERRLNSLLVKSFFDLCKNYSFTWRLELKHIATVLKNYGVHNHLLNDLQCGKHLEKHFQILKKRNTKGRTSFRFSYANFLEEKKGRKTTPVEEDDFKFCVSRFILFISELCSGMPNRVNLRSKNDWSDLCVFCFLINMLGTDKRLVEDYEVSEAISTMYLYLFDSVPTELWYCGAGNVQKDTNGKVMFGSVSFPGSLAVMIHDFPAEEYMSEIFHWRTDVEEKPDQMGHLHLKRKLEHRLNIIHKLEIIPPSYRGNQLKKFLAYFFLQSSLLHTKIRKPNYPSVQDIASNKEIYDATYLKILWHHEQHDFPALLTIVKLLDVIVGQESKEAFTTEKVPAIKHVQKEMLEKLLKKMPTIQTSLKSGQILRLTQLRSHVENVIERWKAGCGDDHYARL